jgi:hypothetical protein
MAGTWEEGHVTTAELLQEMGKFRIEISLILSLTSNRCGFTCA